MRTYDGHRGAVRAITYLPDGRLVSAGQDGRVLLHSAGKPEVLHKQSRPVYAVAVRPAGDLLAFAGRPAVGHNPEVGLYDLPSRRPRRSLPCPFPPSRYDRPTRSVWSLDWSADGRYLAAAARIAKSGGLTAGGGFWWDTPGGDPHPLPADTFAVRFAPRGSELAVARDREVEGHTLPPTVRPVWRLPTATRATPVYTPAGNRIAAAASFLYRPGGQRVKTGLRALTVAVTPDGRALLVGGSPGGVEVYDPDTGEKRAAYDFALEVVHAVAVAPDGLTAAVAGDGGLVAFDL